VVSDRDRIEPGSPTDSAPTGFPGGSPTNSAPAVSIQISRAALRY